MVGFLNTKQEAANLNDTNMNNIKRGASYYWVDVSIQEIRARGEQPDNTFSQVDHKDFGEDNFFIFKIELTANKVTMWLDGNEMQSVNRVDANYIERFFHITPDGANDKHGPSTWIVDYIRMTGPKIPELYSNAVEPFKAPVAIAKASNVFKNTINELTETKRTKRDLDKTALEMQESERDQLPMQLKAILARNDQNTKNILNTVRTDLLANSETKDYYEINNFSVQKMSFLDGFEKDSGPCVGGAKSSDAEME